jgi:CheY-like chemotaxis protein
MQAIRPSILVADNHDGVRETIATVLSMEGYRVIQAADGADVLELLERQVPDLLLLDLSMPKIDGWQVMGTIRPSYPNLPVIIMSATLHAETIAADLGANGFLVKPFQAPELLRIVAEKTTAAPAPVA